MYDGNIYGSYRKVFGNLRLSSETFGISKKCSETFVWANNKFLKIFGKWSEISGKSSKTSLSVCLYNKQNVNTWLLSTLYLTGLLHSLVATRQISRGTLEEIFHIYAHQCIILELHIAKKDISLNRYQHELNDVKYNWTCTM